MIGRIRSGGQSGVDLAALVVASELGIPTEGWMPRGFLTEDGPRPEYAERYGLRETHQTGYVTRTRWNVRDADATLIITDDERGLSGGTELTLGIAKSLGKGTLHECLAAPHKPDDIQAIRHWLHVMHAGHTINVAGPRESKSPGIHARAVAFLRLVLAPEKGRQP